MITLHATAFAKINLSLDILSKRPDGFHDMQMIMQTVSWKDEIEIRLTDRPTFTIENNRSYLPQDSRNIALAATELYLKELDNSEIKGANLTLTKQIPVCAGLGGGSADAAAVLRAMYEWSPIDKQKLMDIALTLGSDVPFCIVGGTQLAKGRGEILSQLANLPDCYIVLARPSVFVSTKDAFNALPRMPLKHHPNTQGLISAIESQSVGDIARHMFNVFETFSPHKIIGTLQKTLINAGALGSIMSGSGPTVFGIFDDKQLAVNAEQQCKELCSDTTIAHPIGVLL